MNVRLVVTIVAPVCLATWGLGAARISAEDSLTAAERLLELARNGQLSTDLAAEAAALLDDRDPFVRGLAEWAIATKVGMDNNRERIVWPCKNPPAWYRRWSSLAPDALLQADYVRQAAVWGIHRDGRKLLGSLDKVIGRARGAAQDARAVVSADRQARIEHQLDVLVQIRGRLADEARKRAPDVSACRALWIEARRAARPIVLAHPSTDFQRLVFVSRHAAHSHRNITGSQYPWVHKPGGDICIKTGLDPAGPVEGVLAGRLGPGHVHGIDLWWDADRVVFAYARQPNWPPPFDPISGDFVFALRGNQEPTHLYEIGLDGTGLVQLTNDPYWSDLEPTYLADGDVVFASDRSGRSSECGKFSADHTVVNLYRLDRKSNQIRCLNDNKDIDRHPHSLDDGLVAYTRWEYQERHFLEVHSVWAVRPDGTMAQPVFKQHLGVPYGLRDTRSVPGSRKLVSIATGHHTFAYGPVVLIDPSRGVNDPGAIKTVTPFSAPQEGPNVKTPVAEGGVPDQGGLYQTPWALSEKRFLVSYSYGRPPSDTAGGKNENGFAIYLIDVFGNKELVHRDLVLSCDTPMPLRPRVRPPRLPEIPLAGASESSGASAAKPGYATCFLADVYAGLPGVPRGAVKGLRILQRVGWPLDRQVGAMRWIPGNAWEKQFGYWSWTPVRVIGTVPVEPDGSAAFRVPAGVSLYFEALDENQMELRRMRSHVTLQPGEVRGCTGCHESRATAPAARRVAGVPSSGASRTEDAGARTAMPAGFPMAFGSPPRIPSPPPWGAHRLLGYPWLIQPIFDRRCVRCHGPEKAEGDIDLSGAVAEDGFLQSFRTLFGKGRGRPTQGPPLVAVSDRFSNAAVTQPMQFGSHRSRVVRVLLDDALHRREAKLAPDEWTALVTWVDANAPYYDTFFNKRPGEGGPPRRDVAVDYFLPPGWDRAE
ncbi:MAG: hypothetical protein NUV77_15640 [Thermoguttaceae bacterium]|jgi:hypothetical protein|nr:hypothetical protein [Thermoguttaceae bacterium]